ncbi:MAG: putative metal-binding motif-containing protein, partial [Deltaproteobacteria bacterium]|nr:putative metal-binding motif-containing protein [Deltaproteobacteria bacterium]
GPGGPLRLGVALLAAVLPACSALTEFDVARVEVDASFVDAAHPEPDAGDSGLDASEPDATRAECEVEADCEGRGPGCTGAWACQGGRCLYVCSDCVDDDSDGFGEGPACGGTDCDEGRADIHEGAPELCDDVDNDCDGLVDEDQGIQVCWRGLCEERVPRCRNGRPVECPDPIPSVKEECGNGRDEDCNGRVDDLCPCAEGETQACRSGAATPRGACEDGAQTCVDGAWGPCEDEVRPAIEVCNGLDDDCDGFDDDDDEGLRRDACPLVTGVCEGTVAACIDGEPAQCAYGAAFEADETACDDLDNDCDGAVDEGCDCGSEVWERACGPGAGVCEPGIQTCSGGVWSHCMGAVPGAEEVCNGE